MSLGIHGILDSTLSGFIFILLLFSIHLICSYHPYHRIIPLLMVNILFILLTFLFYLYILNSELNLLNLLTESMALSIFSILLISPFFCILITFSILKLFLRKRPDDPLLKLLDTI